MPEYGPHMAVPGPPQMCPGPYAGPPPGPHYPPYPSPEFSRVEAEVPKGPFFNGVAAPPPRQKGRPRKKKPKDQEIMTANLDLNSEYMEMGFRGAGGMGSTSRTKRMRTSFKHHQLRTMKSYFAINHNPDAKDLKQLSQKTGLPKRVLQPPSSILEGLIQIRGNMHPLNNKDAGFAQLVRGRKNSRECLGEGIYKKLISVIDAR
ncbi:hypothetical protein ABMA28_000085 [Loxostege sticticalis]|uniref:Homeobox domain-containing protein n=1 Tax=Loxostege sticticalis TaxID=481309 RepID=A0ABD0TQZ9_LOXSC